MQFWSPTILSSQTAGISSQLKILKCWSLGCYEQTSFTCHLNMWGFVVDTTRLKKLKLLGMHVGAECAQMKMHQERDPRSLRGGWHPVDPPPLRLPDYFQQTASFTLPCFVPGWTAAQSLSELPFCKDWAFGGVANEILHAWGLLSRHFKILHVWMDLSCL